MDALTGRRILVAEDEIFIGLEVEIELKRVGAEVLGPAFTLEEARSIYRDGSVDGAILDVDLGGEDVFPLAWELVDAGVPMIFYTARPRGIQFPARFSWVRVVPKPSSGRELISALSRSMEQNAAPSGWREMGGPDLN